MVLLLWVLWLLDPETRTTIIKSFVPGASKGYREINSSPLQ